MHGAPRGSPKGRLEAGRAQGIASGRQQTTGFMSNKKSIELLNKGVADELQAVHQYMYWHFHLDDQGFGPLAMMFKRIAIQEMGHVERLAERILFLKGDVEMVAAGPVEQITDPQKMLAKAAAMEQARPPATTSPPCNAARTPTLRPSSVRVARQRRGRATRPVRQATGEHQAVRPELPRLAVLQQGPAQPPATEE